MENDLSNYLNTIKQEKEILGLLKILQLRSEKNIETSTEKLKILVTGTIRDRVLEDLPTTCPLVSFFSKKLEQPFDNNQHYLSAIIHTILELLLGDQQEILLDDTDKFSLDYPKNRE